MNGPNRHWQMGPRNGRVRYERIRAVTSPADWALLAVLLVQVALGVYVSLVYRWGADWYLDTAVPWLVSLVSLNPKTQYVSSLPWVVQLHMLGGFMVIALFPFSRLVHLIMFPFWYLWRPYQLVIRNTPAKAWSEAPRSHS